MPKSCALSSVVNSSGGFEVNDNASVAAAFVRQFLEEELAPLTIASKKKAKAAAATSSNDASVAAYVCHFLEEKISPLRPKKKGSLLTFSSATTSTHRPKLPMSPGTLADLGRQFLRHQKPPDVRHACQCRPGHTRDAHTRHPEHSGKFTRYGTGRQVILFEGRHQPDQRGERKWRLRERQRLRRRKRRGRTGTCHARPPRLVPRIDRRQFVRRSSRSRGLGQGPGRTRPKLRPPRRRGIACIVWGWVKPHSTACPPLSGWMTT